MFPEIPQWRGSVNYFSVSIEADLLFRMVASASLSLFTLAAAASSDSEVAANCGLADGGSGHCVSAKLRRNAVGQ